MDIINKNNPLETNKESIASIKSLETDCPDEEFDEYVVIEEDDEDLIPWTSLGSLNLSYASRSVLMEANILSLNELLESYSKDPFFGTPKLSLKSYFEIKTAINKALEQIGRRDIQLDQDIPQISLEWKSIQEEIRNTNIEELDFSSHTYSLLKSAGISTFSELLASYEQKTITNVPDIYVKDYKDILTIIETAMNGGNIYKPYCEKIDINRLRQFENAKIEALGFSVRPYGALKRGGIDTLSSLLDAYENRTLLDLSNLGRKSYDEIIGVLLDIEDGSFIIQDEPIAPEPVTYIVPDELESIPSAKLIISNRILKSLYRNNYNTIGKVLRMTLQDMQSLHGVGEKGILELQSVISKIKEQGAAYFNDERKDAPIDISNKREIDIETVNKLKKDYHFKPGWLSEWYHVTRARIQQKLSKTKNRGNWVNRSMTDSDKQLLLYMIETRQEEGIGEDGTKAYFLSNQKDDCAVIYVSEDEIKCFFLNMLPEDVISIVKGCRLDCLSMKELQIMSSGKTISILKEKYFCPDNTFTFRQMANSRGMSLEDYCLFLTGMHYITAQSSVDDEKIVDLLQTYYVDGQIMIPSNNSTRWFWSFIERKGYSFDEIIDLYGDEIIQTVNEDYLSQDTVEPDMCKHKSKSDKWIDLIYANNPLLGNALLSEEEKDTLYSLVKTQLDRRLSDSQFQFQLRDKMLITLAVITYAKEWDTGDESGFWKYITTQFGYRDETNQLRGILCDCILESILKNRRWFISSDTGYQYKSTIVAHALTTKRSWMLLCDFLFDFYKTNMEWTYIEDDPIVARMVFALRSKLIAGDATDDDSLTISAKVYSFQEGIRKLIIYRRRYAIKLIHHMLHRIDNIINHSEAPAKMYVDILCDQWIEGKLKKAREDKHREPNTSSIRNVAIDYTRIRPAYILQNERNVFITLPDIRLRKTDFNKVELQVYVDDINVEGRSLSFYGNELGKTLKGFNIDINMCLRRGNGTLNIRLVLSCDDEVIYDSENLLYRNYLCFSGSKECDIHECEKGTYSFFAVGEGSFEFLCAEVSDIDAGGQWKSFFARLEPGFLVKYNNQIMAVDSAVESSGGSIRIVYPSSDTGIFFVNNGRKYNVVTKEANILLILKDIDDLRKYAITMNSNRLVLNNNIPEKTERGLIYTIPIQISEDKTCEFEVYDFEKSRIISREAIKVIPEISTRFNRGFYYADEDFEKAYVNIIRSQRLKRYEINRNDEVISFLYDNGNIEIKIPTVFVRDSTGQIWKNGYTAWIKEIRQDEKIYVTLPAGCTCSMSVGNIDLMEETKGCFDLGNAIFSYSSEYNPEWLVITLKVTKGHLSQEYNIGRISPTERFIGKVVFDYHDNTLFWNRGQGFIGNQYGKFKLRIETAEGNRDYPLNIEDEVILHSPPLGVNEYKCSIVKESENIFLEDEAILYEGSLFIGDQDELRFTKSMIEITNITYEDGDDLRSVAIRNTYIDQIKYQGIQFVDSEDRECPVYSGVMFFMGKSMKRHDYSFDEKLSDKGYQLYKINPVKIVFINEHTLSITNEEDDGIYYYKYYDKIGLNSHYAITDREPTFRNQNTYYLADLYLFRKERIE